MWIRQPLGLGLAFNLGGESFKNFLRYPILFGHQTWLVGLLHVGIFAVASSLLVAANRYARSLSWREMFSGAHSEISFLHNAAFMGFGGLMTLSALPIHHHYLAMAFPVQFLWIPVIALGKSENDSHQRFGRMVLLALYFLELGISFAMLAYIHQHGAPLGDFGVPLSQQIG
jgi:hypothetical protein